MSYKRFALLFFVCAALPLIAATPKSDGTVKGALTLNGKQFPLTYVYARKREAWPADAKALSVAEGDELSCGIVDLIMVNGALSDETIAAILQRDYRGSDKVRGVHFVIDGSGKYKWASTFLLESGDVQGFGMTQTSGSITSGRHYTGEVSCRNDDVTQSRMFDVKFDTPVKVQYTRTETEKAERIASGSFAEEFVKMLPGEWTIERWLGLGCTTASGTLTVGERTSPHEFRGTFHITTSKGNAVEEEVTISTNGGKVHFEGTKVNLPDVWLPDVFDADLWQNLIVGNNATDFVVLRKE